MDNNPDLNELQRRNVIRVATAEEVAAYQHRFPVMPGEEAGIRKKVAALRHRLDEQLSKASKLSDKAALCRELLKELQSVDAELNKARGSQFGAVQGYTEEQTVAHYVLQNRQIVALKWPRR